MTDTTPLDGRSRVLAVVRSAPEPVSVDEVSDATGLHANTVRGHLEVLLATGAVSRESASSPGRGRPRWLYSAGQRVASPIQYLAEALTTQLSRTPDPGLADAAADQWAHAIPELPLADSPDEAVAEAVDALTRLGFDAVATPMGDAISVSSCPYATLVADSPVICDIHAALVARLLQQTGQPVSLASMEVWSRPDLCVARLRRPDLEPDRVIAMDERGIIRQPEGDTA